jgi:WD40-like Beta Propeller Repeat
MSTDRSELMRRGIRELADAVPVPERGPAELRVAADWRRPRPARGALPALVGAVVVLVVAGVGVLPAVLPGPDVRTGAGANAAVLPRTFATHSHRTADVSAAPPGPVVALYSYAVGGSVRNRRVLVVGADGRRYRELDATTGRGTSTLLAPDGTRVAVRGVDDIAVVDLVTGAARRYPVDTGAAAQLLAWSSDADTLLYLAMPEQPDSFDEPRNGVPVLLDLTSGARTTIPGQRGTVDAAFAPDGRLAVQLAGQLRIVRLDGTVDRTVPVPARHRLAGAAAWSPDGTRLALYRMGESGNPGTPAPVYGLRGAGFPDGLAIVDLAGGGTATTSAPDDLTTLLGWRGDRLLVHRADPANTIVAVPVAGGPTEPLSRLRPGNDHVHDVQLATGLLPRLEVSDAGVDRGPLPASLRVLAAVGVLAAGGLVLLVARRIQSRRRSTGPSRGSVHVLS